MSSTTYMAFTSTEVTSFEAKYLTEQEYVQDLDDCEPFYGLHRLADVALQALQADQDLKTGKITQAKKFQARIGAGKIWISNDQDVVASAFNLRHPLALKILQKIVFRSLNWYPPELEESEENLQTIELNTIPCDRRTVYKYGKIGLEVLRRSLSDPEGIEGQHLIYLQNVITIALETAISNIKEIKYKICDIKNKLNSKQQLTDKELKEWSLYQKFSVIWTPVNEQTASNLIKTQQLETHRSLLGPIPEKFLALNLKK